MRGRRLGDVIVKTLNEGGIECVDRVDGVARELADFAPVGQSAFCQGWQLCVKNALSLGWIVTT